MKIYDYAIIGTGPSGYASLIQLLPTQKSVLVVDRGNLEPETPTDINSIYQTFFTNKSGLKPDSDGFKIYEENQFDKFVLYSSNTVGGFSKVWGRSFDKFHKDYNEIFGEETEELLKKIRFFESAIGPINKIENPILNVDGQDRDLFERLRKKQNPENSVHSSHILLNKDVDVDKEYCKKCGHCIMKCPKDYFFSTNAPLKKLLDSNSNVDFVGATTIDDFAQKNDFVEIIGQNQNRPVKYAARKVFLAAGPLETAKILSKSKPFHAVLLDNAYYMFPFIDIKTLFTPPSLSYSHSLTLFKMVFSDVYGFSDSVVTQIYHPRRLFERLLTNKAPGLLRNKAFFQSLIAWISAKFYIGQVFLSSSDSPHLDLTFENGSVARGSALLTAPKGFFKKILFLKLRVFWRLLRSGCLSFPFFWIKKSFGTSFHIGGTLLSNNQNLSKAIPTEKRVLPIDNPNIVIVDSSVLPELPAGSPTLTIMANSARIASTHAKTP